MFCNQCEQTARGTGCDVVGVCGKQPEVSALLDIIVFQVKGVGVLAGRAAKAGAVDEAVDRYIIESLFTTVTNVDFDPDRLEDGIRIGAAIAGSLRGSVQSDDLPAEALFAPQSTRQELLEQARGIGLLSGAEGPDERSLKHLLLFGLKGMAAYADHALILGEKDPAVFAFFHEALAALCDPKLTVAALVDLNMRCGKTNIRTMELLNQGHVERFGHPVPAQVSTAWKPGPAIVVTGHDLVDLEELLKQTRGKGVNIYTHGEMLPAHGYPGLKKYPHLAGHFGTAWQNQQKEFDGVAAAFLFTTNCIQKPKDSYKDNVFTQGLVGWPGVVHVKNRDYSPVIKRAAALGGLPARDGKTLTTGFGHNAVLGVADRVIAGVKSGAIKRFFLVGGCDGAKPGRNYYRSLRRKYPRTA